MQNKLEHLIGFHESNFEFISRLPKLYKKSLTTDLYSNWQPTYQFILACVIL